MHRSVVLPAIYWQDNGGNDYRAKLGDHTEVYIWSDTERVVRFGRVPDANAIYGRIDIWVCIGVHDRPRGHLRLIHMATLPVFPDHHMCHPCDKPDDVLPIPDADLAAEPAGHLTPLDILLQDILAAQHASNPEVVSSSHLLIVI